MSVDLVLDRNINATGQFVKDKNGKTSSLSLASDKVGIGTAKPQAKLDVIGKAQVHDGSGYAVRKGYMASGSLTIGSHKANYGGGQKWNANTAGLLLETLDNTEIAAHDAGTRVASLMYFEGGAANRITIGRNMGWGPIAQTIVHGNVGLSAAEPGQKLVIEGLHNAGRHAGNTLTYGGQLAIKSNAPQIDFIDQDAGNKSWAIHVNANKLFFVREPWDYKDLVLDGAGSVGIGTDAPRAKLEVVGKAMIHDGTGNDSVARNYMASGSLTIGSNKASYGGGQKWNANTAGLLLETLDNTEIAVHDAGTRVASLMYFEGHATNRITIGRNMGWGAIAQTVLHGRVGVGTASPETRLDVVGTGGGAYPVHFRVNGRLHAQHKQGGMWVGPERTRLIGAVDEGIGLYVNKAWHLVVQKNGYVGVGTRTPSARFEVAGQVKITGGSPGAGKVLTSDANGLASWKAPAKAPAKASAAAKGGSVWSQTGNIVYYDAGNVGVGTAKPASKLHVVGGDINTNRYLRISAWNDEAAKYGTGSGSIWYRGTGGSHGSAANSFIVDKGNWIVQKGNVGVGTLAPAVKLHIKGSVRLDGGELQSWGKLDFHPDVDKTGDDIVRFLNSDGAENMRVHNNGNVGIGTAKPTQKLSVYDGEFVLQTEDNTHDQSILFQNSAGAYTWRLYRTDAGNHYADFRIAGGLNADFNALTDYFSIDKDGNVTVKGAITAAKFVGDGSELAGTQAGGDGAAAAAAPSGDIVATNVSVAPANNQRGVYYLATMGDFNHALYNNYSNADGEGQWDGSKWNCFAGLNVRVGAGKDKKSALYINNHGNVGLGTEQPKGRLSVTGRGAQGWIAADLGDAEQGDRVVMGTFPGSTKAVIGAHNHALSAWADLLLNPAGGNVGIGTMAPVARMDIAQAKRTGTHPKSVRGLYVTGNWSDGSGGVEFRHTNGTQGIGFGYNSIYATGTNANQHLNLLPRGTGGVGIGTKKPAAKVQIINQSQDGNGNTLILGPTNQSNLRLGYHQSYSWIQSHGSKPLALNPVGNFVGIGTTAPAAKVHIEGGSDAKPTDGGYLVIGAIKSENIVLDNNEIMARKDGAVAPLYFQAEGGDFVVHYHRKKGGVVIKDNDNVGIGTLAPTAKLHVVGQVKITGGSPGPGKVLTSDANGLASWQTPAAANGSSTVSRAERGIHQANGNLGIGTEKPEHPLEMGSGAYCSAGGAWTNAASRKVLENIQDLPTNAALTALNDLTPVQFTYKAAPGEAHLGFVAEDAPALVAGDGKGLSPMDLVALLTKAVQEQQKAIAALERHVQSSTGRHEQETLYWGEQRSYDWQWQPWNYEWPPVTGRKQRLKRVR